MAYNMISVREMSRSGKTTVFNEHSCQTKLGDKVLVEGTVKNGLYTLVTQSPSSGVAESAGLVADINLLHQRLAHVHVDGIRNMARAGVVEGLNIDHKHDVCRCQACVYGKSTRAPIPKQNGDRAAHVLDLVHTDVCGPFPEESLGGSLYFVSFVDDHCRYAWVYPIQAMSEVFVRFKNWLAMV
jgi:hypothetical protein